MADPEREKAASKALRRLTPFLVKHLPPDVRHELYARDMLTWHEKDDIDAKADKESSNKTNETILSALERRGPDALDVLIESLEAEEDVNKHVIERIRKEFKDALAPRVRPIALRKPTEEEISIPVEGTDRPTKSVYKMSSNPRGIALIINNKYFTNGMKDRVGTDRDAESLTSLCKYLGFDTRRRNDLTGKQMRDAFEEIRRMDHSNHDCLFICLLSHGINGKLYSIDGELIAVDTVTEYFDGNHCPSLVGKPKVFIIQACRGAKFDYGVSVEATDGSAPPEQKETEEEEISKVLDGDETDGGGYSGALPAEADFILAYATVPGYVSWRNSENGAWFVAAFVQAMKEFAKKEHLLDILTEVNRRVAEEFQSRGRNKQIPAPVSMLTRKLYFRPGSYS